MKIQIHVLAMSCAIVGSAFIASAVEPVVWDTPGKNFRDSMPIGNGDLGLNLWTEQNGDVVFLIGKTDAWTENSQLVKLGRVRVKLTPTPFAASPAFRQILKPREGEIEIRGESSALLRVWVDANAPVIHLEMKGDKPVAMQAGVELWRTQPRRTVTRKGNDEMERGFRESNGNPDGGVVIEPDTILPAKNNRLTWVHHNARSIYPSVFENQHLEPLLGKYPDPLLYRNFGVLMKGPGLVSADNLTLKSASPESSFRLDLYALTNQSQRIEDWQAALDKMVGQADAVDLDAARNAHRQWWDKFWNRSWIKVNGDENAEKVSQGYDMQRWMAAGGGRGPVAMKYNGSIFTVGQEPPAGTPYDPAKGQQNADYRAWGSNFWFQNQRLIYWPMIAAGDFDTLAPFYKMYSDALPLAKDRTKLCFQHDGAVFPETIFLWGLPNNNDFGWGNKKMEMTNRWIRWHVNGSLELIAMMLDTYDATQDADFAQKTLLPLAVELTTYFDQHWKRVDGKIRFDPAAALETRQAAVNPAPDIAGLMYVLPRLLALPQNLTTPAQRAMWEKILADLPPLPRGRTDAAGKNPQTPDQAVPDGKEIIWAAEKFSKTGNVENPELYSVYPFRLFGVNLSELELARATYNAKINKASTCWGQDGIHAACLGWADKAKARSRQTSPPTVASVSSGFGNQATTWSRTWTTAARGRSSCNRCSCSRAAIRYCYSPPGRNSGTWTSNSTLRKIP